MRFGKRKLLPIANTFYNNLAWALWFVGAKRKFPIYSSSGPRLF